MDTLRNIVQPCILCRNERAPVADAKYCIECYKEIIANVILGQA